MRTVARLVIIAALALSLQGCWFLLLGGGAAGGAYAYSEYDEAHRPCPHCHEQIRREATVCRHCDHAVEPLTEDQAQEID